jgi:hypothetical protein
MSESKSISRVKEALKSSDTYSKFGLLLAACPNMEILPASLIKAFNEYHLSSSGLFHTPFKR